MAADLWRWAKEKTRNATYVISGRTETEKLVLEATNEEKWGPTNTQMQEISRLTYSFQDCASIRKVISERLSQTDEVRYVQKTLILLEYILRTGHESFRSEARSIMRTLQMLTSLHRYDVGEQAALESVIRKKAQDIITLVTVNDVYQQEREKANKLKSKVTSVGTAGGYGGGYGGRYGGYSGGGYDDSYDMPSSSKRKNEKKPAPKQESSSEYEYEDEVPPQKPVQQQQQQPFDPFAPVQQQQQQPFDPFAPVQQQQQQPFDPFAPVQQPAQQQQQPFDPFAPVQQQQQQPRGGLLPPPGMAPRPAQPQPAQQPAGGMDLLLMGAPWKPAPQPEELLDLGLGAPAAPQPIQPLQTQPAAPAAPSVNLLDDLMGFGDAPAQPAQTAQPAKPKGGMLDGFGDLVDLNNVTGNQRAYGSVAQVQRGSGSTLANMH